MRNKMARPKKEIEPKEDSYIKVQRVMGQKVTRMIDCEYWRQFPEIYENIMRYKIEELPLSVFKQVYGLKEVKEVEQIEKDEE